MTVAFFGCWERTGHLLHDEHGRSLQSFGPFVPESLDGKLLRCGPRIPGRVDVTCFKDYTVIAFEDNTVDKRGGSNGCFIIEGYALTRRECWTAAEKAFPQIVARLRGHVRMED